MGSGLSGVMSMGNAVYHHAEYAKRRSRASRTANRRSRRSSSCPSARSGYSERQRYLLPASNCIHWRSSLSIAPCTQSFLSRANPKSATVRTNDSVSSEMSSSINNTWVAHFAARRCMRPRANPPAPPRLRLRTTVRSSPAAVPRSRLLALSTTSTRTRPRKTSLARTKSSTRCTVGTTYCCRLKVVIDKFSRTSCAGAADVIHSTRRTVHSPSAMMRTYTTPHVVSASEPSASSTLSPVSSAVATTCSRLRVTATTSARPAPDATTRTTMWSTVVSRRQRPA